MALPGDITSTPIRFRNCTGVLYSHRDWSCWLVASPVDSLTGSFQRMPHIEYSMVLSEHPEALERQRNSCQHPPVCRDETSHHHLCIKTETLYLYTVMRFVMCEWCPALMCNQTQSPRRTGQGNADVVPEDSPGPQYCGEETRCLWGRHSEQSQWRTLSRTNPGQYRASEHYHADEGSRSSRLRQFYVLCRRQLDFSLI